MRIASNGQAIWHTPHAVQRLSSTWIEPFSATLSAPNGHAATQNRLSHWMQTVGISSATERRSTLILDLSGLQTPSCLSEQASSHSLQPVHLFLKTRSRIFSTSQIALVGFTLLKFCFTLVKLGEKHQALNLCD